MADKNIRYEIRSYRHFSSVYQLFHCNGRRSVLVAIANLRAGLISP